MQSGNVRPTGSESDQTPRPSPSKSAWRVRGVLAALLILAVVGYFVLGLDRYFSWDFVRGNIEDWRRWAAENLVLAVVVFFAVYVAVTALSLPVAVVLTLAAGALFNLWLGTAVVSVASTLGATLAFLSSRYVLRDWVRRKFAARLVAIEQGVARDGAYYLFTLRLVPVVPFFLINLGAGLTSMRMATFAAVSWLGMLPATFLYVNAGTKLGSLDSPAGLLSWDVLFAMALLGLVPLTLRVLIRRLAR